MRTLLVDGDMVAYYAAYNCDPQEASGRAVNMVRRYADDLSADRVIVCQSDLSRRYWRHDLYPGYKPNRKPRPEGVGLAMAGLVLEFQSRGLRGCEADDVMGILATHPRVQGEVIMVAADKDLRTVPGRHYNPRHPEQGVVRITTYEADRAHLYAALTGDSTDGYPGCPGIGPERAAKVITGDQCEWWGQVVAAFGGRGLGEDEALLQARVARICRACDFDLTTQQVSPWTPARLGEPTARATHPERTCP